ncbi:UDP-glucose 4-epimerase [Geothrix limicola]|uniref:UDP-glucose 4-epimerase n=1 Tax=Geothrix limicola TaxID=2927978 RepID=A0ABQ5Q9J2_9BACT|nr:NAD-dependent epimerase/dehydratase family protein [Geothrix limicola]GLH71499.1 UDP-glucose 4-epimerase [Geothrix limicola]
MRVLVTGGAGFIGSHAADRCLRDEHEVAVLDNLRSGARNQVAAGVEFIELDTRDGRLAEVVARFRPEAILHFAAQIDVRVSCKDPVYDAEENILSTLRLIEAGLASGLKHFVFASSGGAIYGEASGPQSEGHPEVPINPYGVAKLAVDKYLHAYAVQRGLASCSLRFSNVYGPRQGAKGEAGVIAVFCKRLREGLAPHINGDGLQTRDFVYAPDLAEAASRVLAQRATGVFNLSTGRETSILDVARALCAQAGVDPSGIEHAPAIPGEQRRSILDASKAQRELGWTPATSLTEGMRLTYRWFAEERGDR